MQVIHYLGEGLRPRRIAEAIIDSVDGTHAQLGAGLYQTTAQLNGLAIRMTAGAPVLAQCMLIHQLANTEQLTRLDMGQHPLILHRSGMQ